MLSKILLLLILASAFPAHAQDCVNCPVSPVPSTNLNIPRWPLELIDIEKIDYPRNSRASFCKRPPEMVDTIVIHHTAGFETRSPLDINRDHLNQGSAADPWYMAAYTYFVNSSYGGMSNIRARVTEGRPLDIVGAHAGSNIFVPMDAEQRRLFASGAVTCGRENGKFTVNSSLVQNGRIKANVTTVGIAVIGNYSPFSIRNPGGYNPRRPRNPTQQTLNMLGRLSCQLQKKYPRMKENKWHSYYHPTECPGTLKNYINQIKTVARRLGCEF
jgi:hypothetical protein